jgi:hypothetical protein
MSKTNLGHFQLIALTAVKNTCWLVERGREENTVPVAEEKCEGEMVNSEATRHYIPEDSENGQSCPAAQTLLCFYYWYSLRG